MSSASRPTPANETSLHLPYYDAPFLAALQRFFLKYATFEGRASRSEFWWWALTSWAVTAALQTLSGLTTGNWSSPPNLNLDTIGTLTNLPNLLGALFTLATLIPSIALTWRRIHDTDHSGAWLFAGFVPILGWVALLVLTLTPADPAGRRFDPIAVRI